MNIPAELEKAKTDDTIVVNDVKAEVSKVKTLWADYKAEIIGIFAVVAFLAVIAVGIAIHVV